MEKNISRQFTAIITLLRPQQWLKNSFILLPLFFDHKLLDLDILLAAVIAFFAYSFAASGILTIFFLIHNTSMIINSLSTI